MLVLLISTSLGRITYNVPTLGNSAGLKHPTLFANNGFIKIQNFLYARRPHFAKRVLAVARLLTL